MTQDGGSLLFSCRLDNAKMLNTVLSCLLAGKKEQRCVVEASAEGLCFMVLGEAKYTQANGMLRAELFQAFRCAEGGGRFAVNLKTAIECLTVFGLSALQQTSVSMSYRAGDGAFRMALEEQGILTTCEIATLADEGDDAMELTALASAFSESPEVFRAILNSESLREVMAELGEIPGTEVVTVSVSPREDGDDPPLQFSTAGTFGYYDIELHANNKTYVHVECKREGEWPYTVSALLRGMRALGHAKDTYMRINADGILCIQHHIPTSVGESVFIDFLLCAEEDDDQDIFRAEEGAADAATAAADGASPLLDYESA